LLHSLVLLVKEANTTTSVCRRGNAEAFTIDDETSGMLLLGRASLSMSSHTLASRIAHANAIMPPVPTLRALISRVKTCASRM
jgi:hypothetical protein